jgi:hypothetical protein
MPMELTPGIIFKPGIHKFLSDSQVNPAPGNPGSTEPAPTGAPKESFFSGYIEGTGTTFDIAFMRVTAEGREQVYDFANKQRLEYTYKGDPISFLPICGFNTNLLGLGQSWYVGSYNFIYDGGNRLAIDEQYGGRAANVLAASHRNLARAGFGV